MALYHDATVDPTKPDMLAAWVPQQPWSPEAGEVSVLGAFRFDDPEGQVGIESFLVDMGGSVLHVPVTYRAEPLADPTGLITEMHHTALGTRWVYDGVHDARYLTLLAAVSMTGQGEALGMVQYDGVWHLAPAAIRITGGGWSQTRVAVDGFAIDDPAAATVSARNDGFELTIHRCPSAQERPPLGLSAHGEALPAPVLLAMVSERS